MISCGFVSNSYYFIWWVWDNWKYWVILMPHGHE